MSRKIRIAILDMNDGRENEGIRCIKQITGRFLAQDNIEGNYDIFDVRQKEQIPDIFEYDIFISSGGPGDPKPNGLSWENEYFAFLERIYFYNLNNQDKKFLFLICHSFQLAAIHWNLGNVCKRKSTSFGVMPIHKTPEGEKDLFFKGLDEPFWAVDSRDYQLIEPNYVNMAKVGTKILAKEKIRPHVNLERAIMALRFTPEIFGTQFHPEADSEGMLRYLKREDKKELITTNYGIDKYNSMVDHLDDEDKIMRTEHTILPNFLNDSYQKIIQNQEVFSE